MHSIQRLLLLLTLTAAAACSTPNRQAVPLPDLEAAFTRGDVGRVYVARATQTLGAVRALRVYDGDRFIGTIGRDGLLCWERPAGRNPMRVVYERQKIDGGEIENVIGLDVQAGSEFFYEVRLEKNTKKPEVVLLSEADGRALIAKRKQPRVD
jgi:hypothetical protein